MTNKLPPYAVDDPRLVFVPLDEAAVPPPGLIDHTKDNWWICHPEKGLVYWSDRRGIYPQCNANESLVRRWVEASYPWAEVKFMPSVFRRINISDYT